MTLADLQDRADNTISPALERIDGVASVDISGGISEQIVVEVDRDRLLGYNLSISYLSNFLTADNVLFPGGSVDNGNQTLTVRTDGQFSSLEDVANTLITLPTGGTIRLSEVADVYLETTEQTGCGQGQWRRLCATVCQ